MYWMIADGAWPRHSAIQGGQELFQSHGAYRTGRRSGGLGWSSARRETVAMLCPHPNAPHHLPAESGQSPL